MKFFLQNYFNRPMFERRIYLFFSQKFEKSGRIALNGLNWVNAEKVVNASFSVEFVFFYPLSTHQYF